MRLAAAGHERRARRVLRHPVGVVDDVAAAFRALVGEGDGFWLDSSAPGRDGDPGIHYLGPGERIELGGSVLEGLRGALDEVEVIDESEGALPAFRLGLVGWLEYELRGETLGVEVPELGARTPARFLRVDRMLAVDAATGAAQLLALGPDWSAELLAWRDDAVARLAAATPVAAHEPGALHVVPADADEAYLDKVRACQAAIREGDAYQLCLTTRLQVPGAVADPVELLVALRAASPTHHGGIVRIGDTSLVSVSPERFLTVDRERGVSTSPIKGTRPRGDDALSDVALWQELLASDKERAENLMIVDLMRNDLARVCELGSVQVPMLLDVESYAQVHQLVSTVEGRLLPELGPVDLIASCFPAGSMTGAPKRRATELLAGLERRPRGVYSGAFGWIGYDGACDLAMVIRSIVLHPGGAMIGTGGGITALSVPAEELAETRVKAAPLLAALGAS